MRSEFAFNAGVDLAVAKYSSEVTLKNSGKLIAMFIAGLLISSISLNANADTADSVCENLQNMGHSTIVNDCLSKTKDAYFDIKVVNLINDLVFRGITTAALDAMDASRNKTYSQKELKFCHNLMVQGFSTAVVDCLIQQGQPSNSPAMDVHFETGT